ncbi:MAG: hypothetical protein ACYSWU_28945, partial [Planctomycetota bacterium]
MGTEFNSSDASFQNAPLASEQNAYTSVEPTMYVIHMMWTQSAVTAYNDDGEDPADSSQRWNWDVEQFNIRYQRYVVGQPWRFKQ